MLFSEIASGGVGTGPYGILVIAMVAVFVGGLLVGRTPEFLGKKLRTREITLAALSILVMPALMLVGTEIAVILPATAGALGNSGDPGTPGVIHGFTEVLYAYASAANNNGSAFGGLTVTNDWFQASLGMHVVRAIPADRLRPRSRRVPGVRATCTRSAGTLPTSGVAFAGLLTGTAVLVAALTFFPALVLGPIAEALH